MKSNRLIILAIIMLLFFSPVLTQAQDEFLPPPPPDPIDTPIDGGIGLLVAAGVGYGIKKVRDSRRKKMDDLHNK